MPRIVFAIVATLLAAPALAQDSANTAPKIAPGALTAYSEYDVNADGRVQVTEIEALVPPELKAAVRACDTDFDGAVSEPEYNACQGMSDAPAGAASPR